MSTADNSNKSPADVATQEKLERAKQFKTEPIADVDDITEGDLLVVKKGQSVETHTMPFGDPKIIEEDGSLFIATKARGMLTEGDVVQVLDCIAFERDDKVLPYMIRLLHDTEAVYIIHNDFMNTKTTLASFDKIVG